MKNFIQTITRSSKFHAIAGVLFILSTSSMWGQVCGNSDNNGPGGDGGQGGGQPIAGDPFVPYTGNEFRHIKDLQVWGGVGECQLSWDRWSNSRLTPGQMN